MPCKLDFYFQIGFRLLEEILFLKFNGESENNEAGLQSPLSLGQSFGLRRSVRSLHKFEVKIFPLNKPQNNNFLF